MISCHHNDLLIGHFSINKTKELIAKKYYMPTFFQNMKKYVRGCNIYLVCETVCHKRYGDLQSL